MIHILITHSPLSRPLVILCGYPCSGKTTITNKLKSFFEEKGKETTVMIANRLNVYRDMYQLFLLLASIKTKMSKEFRST